jgi:hypothetical protein
LSAVDVGWDAVWDAAGAAATAGAAVGATAGVASPARAAGASARYAIAARKNVNASTRFECRTETSLDPIGRRM